MSPKNLTVQVDTESTRIFRKNLPSMILPSMMM